MTALWPRQPAWRAPFSQAEPAEMMLKSTQLSAPVWPVPLAEEFVQAVLQPRPSRVLQAAVEQAAQAEAAPGREPAEAKAAV